MTLPRVGSTHADPAETDAPTSSYCCPPFVVRSSKHFSGLVALQCLKFPLLRGALVFAQSILETIVDIFDPLVGMGRGISSTELSERTRGASFVDKLFTPFSG